MPRVELPPMPVAPPEEETGPAPIGVPRGYQAPPRTPEAAVIPVVGGLLSQGAPPRYYDGDEWLPAGMAAEDVARLQQMMDDAGILTQPYRLGVWDDSSRSAYTGVLGYANGAGLSVAEAIDQFGQAPPEQGAPTKLPTFNVSNPEDLRAIFKAASQSTIGKYVDDDQIERMVSAYQQAQLAPQQQEVDDQQAGGGGVVTSAPNPQTFAEAQIRNANPVEAEANDQVRVIDDFMKILSGAGSD